MGCSCIPEVIEDEKPNLEKDSNLKNIKKNSEQDESKKPEINNNDKKIDENENDFKIKAKFGIKLLIIDMPMNKVKKTIML